MKYWIPHIIFAAVAAATLTAMFLCMEMRYYRGDELVEWFIEENDLERKVAEGWYPDRTFGCDPGGLMSAAFVLYEKDGVYFFLRYLKSGDNTRIALALSELQFAIEWQRGRGLYGNWRDKKVERGLKGAVERILSWEDEIATLLLSEKHAVRKQAAVLLAKTGKPSVAFRLKEIADSDQPAAVRGDAVEGLTWLPSRLRQQWPPQEALADKVQDWLEVYSFDKEPEVRRAAISSCSSEQRAEALDDPDIRIQAEAVWITLFCGQDCDRETALSAINSPLVDLDIRVDIAQMLGKKGEKRALPALAEFIAAPKVTERWGLGPGSEYLDTSEAISKITGIDYGYLREDEWFEEFGERVKADALQWWEKHKGEVLKGRK